MIPGPGGVAGTGAGSMRTVSACSTLPASFEAVTTRSATPAAVGVPASVAVPSPWSVNVSPGGTTPLTVSSGTGSPVVVSVKLPLVPATKLALAALVKAGFSWTTTLRVWVASGSTLLSASRLTVTEPGSPVGVPEIVAVPSPSSTSDSPSGSAPERLMVDAGKPSVVTVKESASPRTKVTSSALVIEGASLMVSVNGWSLEPAEFVAVRVSSLTPPGDYGVPASVPVPLSLSVKATPCGGLLAISSSAVGSRPW